MDKPTDGRAAQPRKAVHNVMMEDPVGALDEAAFEQLADASRRELQLHCYRMLGSFHDAEDAVQEAFLRAWRGREAYTGRGSVRGWLHRIATNVCLRMLERRAIGRRLLPEVLGPPVGFEPLGQPATDVSWLEPYPGRWLVPDAADPTPGPEARYEAHETVGLAFVAALQALPPRQRAALLLRDVVGLSASETAAVLEASAAATNSALQRARATIEARYPGGRPTTPPAPDPAQQPLLDRYLEAWDAADVDGLVRLLAADATWSMPPWPQWYCGRSDIGAFLRWAWRHGAGYGRLLPTWANGRPAFGYYRRSPEDPRWHQFAIQVLELHGGEVRSITNFVDRRVFRSFALPPEPPGTGGPMIREPLTYRDR